MGGLSEVGSELEREKLADLHFRVHSHPRPFQIIPVGPAPFCLAPVDTNIQSPETHSPYEIGDVAMQNIPNASWDNGIGRGCGGAESGSGSDEEEEYFDHESDGEVGSEHGGDGRAMEEPDGDEDDIEYATQPACENFTAHTLPLT
ncbi:hypothetical protein BU15DRAFT_68156 [Melanogaster broomeanus]|nr:hypothetical protein BU15DRAFT_68156 [Melanogaster broomeanus]